MKKESNDFRDNIKKLKGKQYNEKWKFNTLKMILLSLTSILITIVVTMYKDFKSVNKCLYNSLGTGTLFVISLSLSINLLSEKDGIAEENKYFIKGLKVVQIILMVLISLFYGSSYDEYDTKFKLEFGQIIWSFIIYILTIIVIGFFNYLNRTDNLNDAITESEDNSIIEKSNNLDKIDKGGMKL
jgi:hypothetical protein